MSHFQPTLYSKSIFFLTTLRVQSLLEIAKECYFKLLLSIGYCQEVALLKVVSGIVCFQPGIGYSLSCTEQVKIMNYCSPANNKC